jgi:hypothetical protein
MSRGWESKAIEIQQEEAALAKGRERRPPSAGERADGVRRQTLELARAKTRADLARATTPVHREMLRRALEDLDARIRSPGSD